MTNNLRDDTSCVSNQHQQSRCGILKLNVSPELPVPELPLNCRFKTCESDLQFAIFEIQANRGFSKGAQCSGGQNTGGNYFVGPKITLSDPVVSLN